MAEARFGVGRFGVDTFSAGPVETVELGLAANAMDPITSIVWTDISDYVFECDSSRGRNHELGRVNAGQFSCVVDNQDGRFDPSNTTGPYYPNLKPMKWIRWTTIYSSTVKRIFTGHVDDYKIKRIGNNRSEVVITATDAFKKMNLQILKEPYPFEVLRDGPAMYFEFNEEHTSGAVVIHDSSGNRRDGTLFNSVVEDRDAGNAREGFELGDNYGALSGPGVFFWDEGYTNSGFARGYGLIPNTGMAGTGNFSLRWYMNPQGEDTFIPAILVIGDQGDYIGSVGDVISIVPTKSTDGLVEVAFRFCRNGAVVDSFAVAAPGLYGRSMDPWTLTRIGDSFTVRWYNATLASTTLGVTLSLSSRMWIATGTSGAYIGYPFYAGFFDELHMGPVLSDARSEALLAAAGNWGNVRLGDRLRQVAGQVSWPLEDTDFESGSTLLGPFNDDGKSVLSYAQDVIQSEDGLMFIAGDGKWTAYGRHHLITNTRSTVSQATFGDGGGTEIAYTAQVEPTFDEQDLWNRVTMTPRNGLPQTVSDAASIAAYGIRELGQTGLLGSVNDAHDRATFKLRQYKDPLLRVRQVPIERDDSDSLFYSAVTLDLWDRVTYKQRLLNASVFTQDSLIEGVHHSYDARTREREMKFNLSPADASVAGTSYWILNTSALNSTTALAY